MAKTSSDACVHIPSPNPLLPWEPWATLGSLGLGGTFQHTLPPSSLPLCTHTVGLPLQAAIKGIDLYAFGQSHIDVGQVKPSQRKIHVLS